MGDVVIRAEGIGKKYRIGTRKARYKTLRDTLTGLARLPRRFRIQDGPPSGKEETVWALRDVSFGVRRGEIVGLMGRNGAGKSTLLKVLSRITEPTEGYAEVRGRVGCLLEVGSGFHPELSGAENVYLNGAILGMTRAEIKQKFDEIVAFAEVEPFIDTPVKHYSSGMYLRLAFAVAAHLEPDILLVDEVLAVGDAAFQKKSLGKIDDVAKQGRTVIFVSHNMPALGRLCPNVIWLERGGVVEMGSTSSVIAKYLASSDSFAGSRFWTDLGSSPGDEFIRARSVRVLDSEGAPTTMAYQDQPFVVSLTYQVLKSIMNANVGFEMRTDSGVTVFSSFDSDNPEWSGRGRQPGIYVSECRVPGNLLNEGTYYLTLHAGIPYFQLCIMAEDVLRLRVGPPISGESPIARTGGSRPGVIAPELSWKTQRTEEARTDSVGPAGELVPRTERD